MANSVFNLSNLNGSNGFKINGITAGDRSGFSVSSAGDINGDGFDELIIGAYAADPNGSYSGQSYVVFGKSGGFTSALNLSDLDGSNGFIINGITAFDNLGRSVSSARDVNGDGFDDLIIGALGADPNGSISGQSYVVFGKSGSFNSTLNLSDLDGSNGFAINGITAYDFSGRTVSSAGDVNGDGFDDLIISAFRADPNGNESGQSYVVFGKSGGFTSALNLSDLNGSNGFIINGITAGDNSGSSVSSAGDVNGDGFDDLIIGAFLADPNGSYSGQSYVVFGKSGGFTSSFNLSDLNGSNGFKINGITAGDYSGRSVSSAGDVNGDGFDDLIIGAEQADPNGSKSGQSYVVFGKSGGFTSAINLSDLNGSNGFVINGITALDRSGYSVSSAGDVNGDGFNDLIIGAYGADPNGNESGQSYVVFGKSGGFTSAINLSDLNGSNGFAINGMTSYDYSGSAVSSAGDVNGDGLDDLIIGAFRAEPNGGNSGQSYVVFGNAAPELDLNSGNRLVNGFAINGITANDYSGWSVSSAGDVNGDGFDDLIIGAFRADPNGSYSGQSYVVFGKNGGFTSTFNLSDLDGSNGFAINGITANDLSGRSVSSAGDVNGDGFDDLIIGASGADPNGRISGQSYVVFGKSGGFTSSFNLSDLNGSNGFAINGITAYDFSGRTVSSAGDVNGDGFDDLIIGAVWADPNGSYSGQSYVVFGKSGGFTSSFNLSDLNGSNGFAINGITAGDNSGFSVSSAGDVNSDGFDDLIIGAYGADPNGSNSGQSYVVFGKSGGYTSAINLSDLNGSNGFAINGITANDNSGWSVSSAGDVNGDGFDDLIIGAFWADPNGSDSGQSYVVFGKSGGFTSALNLSDLNGSNGFAINGITANDFSGLSVSSAGDVNGDGFDDLIIGAVWADPNGSRSGQSYVVFGKSGSFNSTLNLSNLNGSNGFKINGITALDFSGFSVSNAGDVNGDGFDDLIIGAYGADPNGSNSGQSYVVFGGAAIGAGGSLELSQLGGSAVAGIDFHATFTFSPVSIVSSNLSLVDRNSSTLTQATITITNPLDGLQEFVFADTTGTAITADYNSATATLTLSGIDTVANYQKVLRTVEYFNTAANPNTTARTIEFVVDDGEAHSNTSAVATTTITFTLPDSITGTNSSEVIVGTNIVNIIDGKRGNDVIYGYQGDGVSGVGSTATVPTLNPAGGGVNDHDIIRGGAGNDTMYGGGGNDTFLVSGIGDGFDTFFGDDGYDTVVAETAGTVIGVIGYNNGVEEFVGHSGADTIIKDKDFNSGNILNFSNTKLTNIAEVNANRGNDTVVASNLSNMQIRGDAGNDILNAGLAHVTWLYSGTTNGFDTFTNGTGVSIAQAETAGTVIGVIGYNNGVDEFVGHSSGDTVIRDVTSGNILNFSNTILTNIAEVNANGGNDTVIASNLSSMQIRGGAGNDNLTAGSQTVTFVYDNTKNGFDSFNNGAGISTILAEADGTIIGLASGFNNGVDQIDVNGKTNIKVLGTGGNDTLNFSNVTVINNPSNFELNGGNGNDTIIGTGGDDRIVGGAGRDALTGGIGVDSFVFNAQSDSRFRAGDAIADFDATNGEIIVLSAITGGIGSFNVGGAFTVGGVTNEAIVFGSQLRVDLNANGIFNTGDLEINFTTITGTFNAANLVF